jgi:hypothetical protein
MAMVLILPRSERDSWYADVLLQRGHQVIAHYVAAENQLFEYVSQCDGCLLLGNSDDQVKVADRFEELGKPVWRHLGEVPRDRTITQDSGVDSKAVGDTRDEAEHSSESRHQDSEHDGDEIDADSETIRRIIGLAGNASRSRCSREISLLARGPIPERLIRPAPL